jgi:hypothetical protein
MFDNLYDRTVTTYPTDQCPTGTGCSRLDLHSLFLSLYTYLSFLLHTFLSLSLSPVQSFYFSILPPFSSFISFIFSACPSFSTFLLSHFLPPLFFYLSFFHCHLTLFLLCIFHLPLFLIFIFLLYLFLLFFFSPPVLQPLFIYLSLVSFFLFHLSPFLLALFLLSF